MTDDIKPATLTRDDTQHGHEYVLLSDHRAAVAAAVAADRERLAKEFKKRAAALETTGAGTAPHIQAQYEAMAGELLDWACTLDAIRATAPKGQTPNPNTNTKG